MNNDAEKRNEKFFLKTSNETDSDNSICYEASFGMNHRKSDAYKPSACQKIKGVFRQATCKAGTAFFMELARIIEDCGNDK